MTKLTYVRPTMIDHGDLVERTKGQCTCHTEDEDAFKPLDYDEEE